MFLLFTDTRNLYTDNWSDEVWAQDDQLSYNKSAKRTHRYEAENKGKDKTTGKAGCRKIETTWNESETLKSGNFHSFRGRWGLQSNVEREWIELKGRVYQCVAN